MILGSLNRRHLDDERQDSYLQLQRRRLQAQDDSNLEPSRAPCTWGWPAVGRWGYLSFLGILGILNNSMVSSKRGPFLGGRCRDLCRWGVCFLTQECQSLRKEEVGMGA